MKEPSTDPAEVDASLTNSDGTSNIYLTEDPTTNVITLTLTNGLGKEIVFPPGQPVAYDQLPPGQSAVYIFFNALIDNADIAGISLTSDGWVAGTFTDPSTELRYLGIAPKNQVTVPPGGALSFTLTRVLVPGSPRFGNADVMLAGATGITPDQGSPSLFINIVNPLTPGKKTLALQIGFKTPALYTGAPQSLTLHLVNPGPTALVPGGTKDWHDLTPTFQLTLVYGDSAGSITTLPGAAGISVNISDAYHNIWKPVQRRDQGQSPYWIMQPDPNGSGTVLGTGDQAAIEFEIAGIEATLPAGLDSAITLAYVSWYDIPGYDEGSTAVIITKNAGPKVVSFTASPLMVPFGQPGVQTVLTWATEHTTGVRFDAPQIGNAQDFRRSGSGPIPGGINAPLGASLTLIAYKDVSEQPKKTEHKKTGRKDDPPELEARASLRIAGAARTDISAGIDALSNIVFPPGSPRAFAFQGILGNKIVFQQTKATIMDIATRAITGTVDLGSLIPGGPQGTTIEDAVPSPDGKTIHVLVSHDGGSSARVLHYLLPLQVASATYGNPVALGPLLPSGSTVDAPSLLATPEGRTVYLCAAVLGSPTYLFAYDAVSYATKGSWINQKLHEKIGPTDVVGSNQDGSRLLLGGWGGIAALDVADGFTELTTMIAGEFILLPWAVSADARRAYTVGYDPNDQKKRNVLTYDVDLAAGSLRLANTTPLGVVPAHSGASALSADGQTFYVWASPDTLTALDTTTFTTTPYVCGVNGSFTPLLIAAVPHSLELYCTGAGGVSNGTVEVVTIY